MLIFRGVTTPVAKGIPVTRQEESQVSGFLHDSGKTPLKFKTSPLKSYKKPKKVRMIVLQASIFRGKLAVKKRPVGTWTHTPFASPHRARRRWVERCHMRQVPYLWPKATGRWFKHLGVWGQRDDLENLSPQVLNFIAFAWIFEKGLDEIRGWTVIISFCKLTDEEIIRQSSIMIQHVFFSNIFWESILQ